MEVQEDRRLGKYAYLGVGKQVLVQSPNICGSGGTAGYT